MIRGSNMTKLTLEGRIRKDILDAALKVKRIGAHIAPSLSLVEICTAVLQNYVPGKDVFVLSKAHGALGYYATMHQLSMMTEEQFQSFEENGGDFPGQPCRSESNHLDYSGGSLGMGLSYGTGRAWSDRDSRVFVILGDGELDEGSNWESAAVAAKLHLNNLCAIVDRNGFQSDGKCEEILDHQYSALWKARGWHVEECDGHDTEELKRRIRSYRGDQPFVLIADTIKGKGISFMENHNEWHHHELKQEQYDAAIAEIGERYGLREE